MGPLYNLINDNAIARENIADRTTPFNKALAHALELSHELALHVPDAATRSFLGSIAALCAGSNAIAITPASATVGLYMLNNINKGTITFIEPEAETQRIAKIVFKESEVSDSSYRFLSARKLDVLTRLADSSYGLIYGDVTPMRMLELIKTSWPLLRPGGMLIIENALLDGTVKDSSRRDRNTVAAREANDFAASIEDAHLSYLPLGGGMLLLSKQVNQ